VKYLGFFKKGATSVSARFDYWRAAVQTARGQPVFGTGPGTFGRAYQQIKRPESESTKMVHNDYLEQASDSGLPGLVAYTVFIIGGLVVSFPGRRSGMEAANSIYQTPNTKHQTSNTKLQTPNSTPGPQVPAAPFDREDWLAFWVWLGVLGWALQGFVEFGLYLPALAWPAFALLGWLLGRSTLRPEPR
jgi:O-antigen ligase